MKVLKKLGKALQMGLTLLLAALLLCNLYVLVAQRLLGVAHPTVFGFSTAVVISGSMEPAIGVNDMIFIHHRQDYVPGDIITYDKDAHLVTHRIVEKTEEGFFTQGDANNVPDDQPVQTQQILGKVVLHIPGVGALIGVLQTPLGMTCLVFVGLILVELPYLLRKRKEIGEGGSAQ